jgi:hypothetical protein
MGAFSSAFAGNRALTRQPALVRPAGIRGPANSHPITS